MILKVDENTYVNWDSVSQIDFEEKDGSVELTVYDKTADVMVHTKITKEDAGKIKEYMDALIRKNIIVNLK